MKHYVYIVVLLVSAGVVTGMSRMDTQAEAHAVNNDSQATKSAHKQTVKPHANIDIDYVVPYPIQLNEVVNLPLSVRNGQDAEDVKIQVTFDQGLVSADGITEFSFGSQPAGAFNQFELNFVVEAEGRVFINVFASMRINGQYQTRSFAIPVVAGDMDKAISQPSGKGLLQETPEGEKIISMPAKESAE